MRYLLIAICLLLFRPAFTEESDKNILTVSLENKICNQERDSVDRLICRQNMAWIPNYHLPWQQFIKTLKKGGKGRIRIFFKDSLHYKLIKKQLTEPKWQGYTSYMDYSFSIKDYLIELSAHEELSIDRFQIQETALSYRSEYELRYDLKKSLPYIIDLPEELQGEFLDELTQKAMHHRFMAHNNQIQFISKVLCINFTRDN